MERARSTAATFRNGALSPPWMLARSPAPMTAVVARWNEIRAFRCGQASTSERRRSPCRGLGRLGNAKIPRLIKIRHGQAGPHHPLGRPATTVGLPRARQHNPVAPVASTLDKERRHRHSSIGRMAGRASALLANELRMERQSDLPHRKKSKQLLRQYHVTPTAESRPIELGKRLEE